MKPSRPGQITVTVQDDRQTALLSIAPLDDALRYVWFKDGALFETTEQPQCTVSENGIYKVAGENEAGRGAFSDEAQVDLSEFGPDNLLTEEFIPDAAFREWLNEKLAGGSGFYSITDAAAYDGEFDINSETGISNIDGIRYFTSLKRLKCSEITSLSSMEEILQLTKLEYLWIMFSSCTEFDLTPLKNLEEAHIMANSACKPDGLKVAGLNKLRSLSCNNNNLESLDLTGCTALEELVCSYNSLSDDKLILPDGAPLSILAVHTNGNLTRMELSKYASTLTFLNIGNTGFKELDPTRGPEHRKLRHELLRTDRTGELHQPQESAHRLEQFRQARRLDTDQSRDAALRLQPPDVHGPESQRENPGAQLPGQRT